MSWKKALRASGLAACCLLTPATLFSQGSYLDVYIARLKPEKAAEAEAIAKKITDANRQNNGDRVIVEQPLYGDPYTLIFLTPRESYADVDKGNDAFMASLHKAFGKEGSQRIFNDWNNCLVSARTQLRMRRPDLSSKMPADAQAFAQLVGESRVLRTFVFHVRPGHAFEFEGLIKEINARANKMSDTQPVLVSQVVEGENDGAYYISFLRKSLAGFDKEVMLPDILGKEGMEKFEKTMADVEQHTESALYRFRPDLSWPPDAIAQASADYWNPKPVMAMAKAKTKNPSGADATPAGAKSADKSKN
jgi:hypothetical protein